MTPLIFIFLISGLITILLIIAKYLEQKMSGPLLIFSLISKGDFYIREIYHRTVHLYSDGREDLLFFWEKQVPLHSRNFFNKLVAYLKERREQYFHNMRDSRLLKKSDGISEFFKNISSIERGNGVIHDSFEGTQQNNLVGLGSQERKDDVR